MKFLKQIFCKHNNRTFIRNDYVDECSLWRCDDCDKLIEDNKINKQSIKGLDESVDKILNENPEGLSRKDIHRKIDYLEHSILLCLIRSGEAFCVNRIARVKLLRTYLT